MFSQQDYAMRIWLKPEKLAAYNLVPSDVSAALSEQSLEAAAGSLGENNGESFSYVIKYGGRFKTENQYSDIILTFTLYVMKNYVFQRIIGMIY